MPRTVRSLLLAVAGAQAIGALLLLLQAPWVVTLPPFAGRTAMSNVFLAAFLLAAAAATGWCLSTRSDRAFAGIGVDTLLIFGSMAAVLFVGAMEGGGGATLIFGALLLLISGAGGWLLRWALSRPWRDPLPTPPSVLASFGLFVVALLTVGTLLVLRVPNVLPWRITPELSTLFGLMFLSASSYYAYGLVDRRWENAGGQLAAFLAYDAVLVVPLASRFVSPDTSAYDATDGSLPVNLVLYIAVILYSAALAVYHLFVATPTRLRFRARAV